MKKITLLFICLVSVLNISAEILSGSCGPYANYTLDTSTGVLSITGTGTMYGYNKEGAAPWYSNRSYIKTVNIANGITSIDDYAFSQCSSLISVTIPNSVTSIGNYVFRNSSNLTSVTISNSITSIGEEDFSGCSNLKSIEIPNSVTSIGANAFRDCISLTSVVIPNSVTSIGYCAFYGCYSLTSITIPNSTTSIGNFSFSGCSGLTSISIPNSVTSLGYDAFEGCYFESFSNNSNLNEIASSYWGAVIVDSREYGCAIIDGVLIKYFGNYKSVTIPSSVTSIKSNVFSTRPIKTIWLTNTPPNNYSYAEGAINYVANSQYSGLSNMKEYKFLSSLFEVDGIRYVPVSPSERTCDVIDCVYDESLSVVNINTTVSYKGVSMKVQNVQPYTFYQNPNLKVVWFDIDGGIGKYVLYGCKSLLAVVLGQNVTSIGEYAFSGCSKLERIQTPDYITPELVKHTYIIIPGSVNSIGNYAFSGCKELKTVIIEDSETDITLNLGCNGNNPLFADCPLDSVYIGRNISYGTGSNYGYSPFYRNTTLRSITITDKETEISENEFYGCTNLQNVQIGDGVTSIGSWAFSGCSSLKNFSFGTQVQTIGKEAFSDCTGVTAITSKVQTPPTCGSQALDDINKWECKLYVPEGHVADYQAADQWKEFFFVEEGEGGGDTPIDPSGNKCATPTIEYVDGQLSFNCETEDVNFVYDITSSISGQGTNVTLPTKTTYIVKVYATKEGFEDSNVAMKEINVGGKTGIKGDVNEDGTVNGTDIQEVINIIVKGDSNDNNYEPRVRFGFYETIPGYSVTIDRIYVYLKNMTELCSGIAGSVLSTTSDNPTWDKKGDYTTVSQNETNTEPMHIIISYHLTAEDGSGETISIRDAQVDVPTKYLQWQYNRDYNYLFKISHKESEYSEDPNPVLISDIYPITLDNVIVVGHGATR